MRTTTSISKLGKALPVAIAALIGLGGAQLASADPAPGGSDVLAIEQHLAGLHYEVGPVDGTFDQDTAYGVTAFQKVNGLPRTGQLTDDVRAAITASTDPPPSLSPGGGPNRVEIDLDRQVLFLYEGDALSKVLPVSTGSGERFCSQGRCRDAVTNEGSFQIYRQDHGWETSPLGRLYNAQYFDGGIAIHGSTSVPPTPASHGCVRIPMSAAEWFPSHISVGTPVYVVRGAPPPPAPPPPVPAAAAPAPAAAPPPAPSGGGLSFLSSVLALLSRR